VRLLEGRSIAITGAGRGIGAGIARLCAEQGASVVVNDLGVEMDGSKPGEAVANQLVNEIHEAGGVAVAHTDDIATVEGGASLVQMALDMFGKLDVLINCAGILRDRMIFNLSEEDWNAVIRVHLNGHFNTIKPAAQYWRGLQNPDGQYRIINFTSGSALFGAPAQPNYAAAKMGVVGLTYSCANALAKYGVTSNAISPIGRTRMVSSIPENRERRTIGAEEFDPNFVAPPVAYLASEASGWCNGQVIGAGGNQVTLFTRPQALRQLVSDGPWDLERLIPVLENTFRPATEGKPR
jgi:NAD(P)-dependent dehydrogenase (short-subunit alcohol dehydrogenase family)